MTNHTHFLYYRWFVFVSIVYKWLQMIVHKLWVHPFVEMIFIIKNKSPLPIVFHTLFTVDICKLLLAYIDTVKF